MDGIVLTHAYTTDQVADALRWGGYTALKVITGWGLEDGWNLTTRKAIAAITPSLVVRSVAGDPSYADGGATFPIASELIAEFQPWYAVRQDCWLEIGNEPNMSDRDSAIWDYRYWLSLAIPELRKAFPLARLIAPGLRIDPDTGTFRRWLTVCADVFAQCDAVAVHLYEYDAFLSAEQTHGSTHQAQAIAAAYPVALPKTPLIVTEYGIDRAIEEPLKGRRYAALVRHRASTPPLPSTVQGYLAYHLCAKEDVNPEYAIHRSGHESYRGG
jgi:hypothetical protein